MVPYGIGQTVQFKKNFGPNLGSLELDRLEKVTKDNFTNKLSSVYNLLSNLKNSKNLENRDLIASRAPWTLLVYMINKVSPKTDCLRIFSKTNFN